MQLKQFLLFILFVVFSRPISAQVWVRDKLLPTGNFHSPDQAEFGSSVDIDGEYAIIGAPKYSQSPGGGAAFVYRYHTGNWHLVATLTTSYEPSLSDGFGTNVSISGNTVVVSGGSLTEKAFVFQRPGTEWSDMTIHSAVLVCRSVTDVSISGNTIAVGNAVGGLMIFERPEGDAGWSGVIQPVATISPTIEYFGYEVDVSGNTIAVTGPRVGVFLYVRPSTGWVTNMPQTAILTNDFPDLYFGQSISIQDSTVVVGSPSEENFGIQCGAVYVFQKPKGGWVNMGGSWVNPVPTAKLLAPDPIRNMGFGSGVVVDGPTIVIATIGTTAYLFEKPAGGWMNNTESANLTNTGEMTLRGSEESIALSNGHLMIGAASRDGQVGDVAYYARTGDSWIDASESRRISSPAMLQNNDLAFGSSVDIEGNYAVVGTSANCLVHLFEKTPTGWEVRAKFNHGGSAAISGDVVVIGGNQKAYVYEKPAGGWNGVIEETGVLTAGSTTNGHGFGSYVAIDGDEIAILGTYGIFPFSKPAMGWQNMAGDALLRFYPMLSTMVVKGDKVIASSRKIYEPEHNDYLSGFALLYTKPATGWVSSNTPTAEFKHENPYVIYGSGADIVDDYVAVTGYLNNTAYVFLYTKPDDGWDGIQRTPTATLSVNGGVLMFQHPVSISADGEHVAFWPISNQLHVFNKPVNGWGDLDQSAAETMPVTVGVQGNALSKFLDSDVDYLLVGVPGDSERGLGAGAVFSYTRALVTSVEVGLHSKTMVYPNPVSNQLKISFGENTPERSIKLCDFHGRILRDFPLDTASEMTIDVRGLEPGIYLLHTNSSAGTETIKFIKH